MLCSQASLIAEAIMQKHPEAVRVLFNKFHSAISFKPTVATVLSAEVSSGTWLVPCAPGWLVCDLC